MPSREESQSLLGRLNNMGIRIRLQLMQGLPEPVVTCPTGQDEHRGQ
jgi:hypothetical protein